MIVKATRGFNAGSALEAAGIPAEGLFFDVDAHAYYLNGRRIPGVTDILKDVGFIDTTYYTEDGRQHGTDVHEACEAVDRGDAPLEDVPADIFYEVRSWVRFRDEHGFEADAIEEPRASAVYGYAGTPDRVGTFARGPWQGRRFVIDFKTGAPEKWWRYQLAAYRGTFDAQEATTLGRMSLRLDPAGAKPEPYANHLGDWRVFAAALTVYAAKRGAR